MQNRKQTEVYVKINQWRKAFKQLEMPLRKPNWRVNVTVILVMLIKLNILTKKAASKSVKQSEQ